MVVRKLIGGVVDKEIQSAEFLDRARNGLRAELRFLHISRNQRRTAALSLHLDRFRAWVDIVGGLYSLPPDAATRPG